MPRLDISDRQRCLNVLAFEPYAFDQLGGNSRTQLYLLRGVDRSRFNLTLLVPFESRFSDLARDLGVSVCVVPPDMRLQRYGGRCLNDGPFGRVVSAMSLARYYRAVARLIRERDIDIAYCCSIRGVMMIGPAVRFCGRPLVWYVDGELQNPVLDRIGARLANRILFYAECNKRDKYAALADALAGKMGVVRIGLDMTDVEAVERTDRSALARELDVSRDTTNIVVLGQLYAPKGVHIAIEALARVVQRTPAVKLYVVGDHVIDEYRPYRRELDALVTRHGLADKVVFTGWRTDALHVLSLMDILVHPSFAEGFGRAVLEGMAFRKAVVASRVGGLREAVDEGRNGFLVEPGDVAGLADRMLQLIESADLRLRMGDEGRATVLNEYTVANSVLAMERVWAETAAAYGRTGRMSTTRAGVVEPFGP